MTDFDLGPAIRSIVDEINTGQAATAPPGAREVTVYVTVGDPEPGHWCNRCLLPSAAELSLDGIHGGGVVALGRVRLCPDCGNIERS